MRVLLAMIHVANKRAKRLIQDLCDQPNTIVIDLTHSSDEATFRKFSPLYAHKCIPLPGAQHQQTTFSVEGAWQGLKVFEDKSIDTSKFSIANMRNIKRKGVIIGHQYGQRIIDYKEAIDSIYIPMYIYALEHYLQNELMLLIGLVKEGNSLVFLDYKANSERSHAKIVKQNLIEILESENATHL